MSMVVRGSKSPSPQPSPGVPGEGAGSALGRDSGAVERSKSNHRGARRGRQCGADSKGGIADGKSRMLAALRETVESRAGGRRPNATNPEARSQNARSPLNLLFLSFLAAAPHWSSGTVVSRSPGVDELVHDARGVHGAASGDGGSHGTARSYTIRAPCTAQKLSRHGACEREWIVDNG